MPSQEHKRTRSNNNAGRVPTGGQVPTGGGGREQYLYQSQKRKTKHSKGYIHYKNMATETKTCTVKAGMETEDKNNKQNENKNNMKDLQDLVMLTDMEQDIVTDYDQL